LSRGFIINGWTPDTEEDIIRTIQTGAQFITTNRPDILKKILSKNEEG
jgi:glycerophosphoryl diester phosphodiesterase